MFLLMSLVIVVVCDCGCCGCCGCCSCVIVVVGVVAVCCCDCLRLWLFCFLLTVGVDVVVVWDVVFCVFVGVIGVVCLFVFLSLFFAFRV